MLVMAATIFMRSPQAEQNSGSSRYTSAMSFPQLRRRFFAKSPSSFSAATALPGGAAEGGPRS
jgi:hypothetical protein